ncbi:MAG: SIS domain-containing protein [Bryobacteraceae bacterium]|nr:SIS domain-containing protein [Bryobacteraceae bacterium]
MSLFLAQYRKQLEKMLSGLDLAKVQQAIEWLAEAREQGRQIFVFGNGGSASTASHFATDLVKGASYGRARRFRILALTDSLPTITAYANDTGYENVFVEQLKNFAREGDVVIGISSSGNSPNVIRAIEYAASAGCRSIGLTGGDGGKLGPLVHLEIRAPETHTGRIEDAHFVICHMIGYYFMEEAEPCPRASSPSRSG